MDASKYFGEIGHMGAVSRRCPETKFPISIPQYRVAEYKVDLMVHGLHGRVAVECDGDHWHGPDRYEADMDRQRELERCGLQVIRISGSSFYLDREGAIDDVADQLRRQYVYPGGAAPPDGREPAPTGAGREPGSRPQRPENGNSEPLGVDSDLRPSVVSRPARSLEPVRQLLDPAPPVPLGQGSPAGALDEETDAAYPEVPSRSPEPAGGRQRSPGSAPPVGPVDTDSPSSDVPPNSLSLRTGGTRVETAASHRVPPSSAPTDRVAAAIVQMIDEEGPVIVEILFRHYVRASGGRKVGNQIRDDLLRALDRAVATGRVIRREELGDKNRLRAVVRTPSTPEVVFRDRTPEYSIREIPASELASVMRSLGGDYQGGAFGESLYRRVLRKYHMVRLTEDAQRYLEEVARYYLR